MTELIHPEALRSALTLGSRPWPEALTDVVLLVLLVALVVTGWRWIGAERARDLSRRADSGRVSRQTFRRARA